MGVAASSSNREDGLIAKRDGLLSLLRRNRVPGVRGAGLTRTGGTEHLLLLVAPGFGPEMPRDFEGVPVTVRETGTPRA